MKALSVRAPWWWFIIHGHKDIENREWKTNFRGRVLIHASSWFRYTVTAEDQYWAVQVAGLEKEWLAQKIPSPANMPKGCLVGSVDIVGCVSDSDSPWFFGKYGFVLANPVAFEKPIPFKGALGFFDVPDGIEVGR
jgi:hypothetical protein